MLKNIFFPLNKLSIMNDRNGRPFLFTDIIDASLIDISISHTTNYAISFAILKTNDKYS